MNTPRWLRALWARVVGQDRRADLRHQAILRHPAGKKIGRPT